MEYERRIIRNKMDLTKLPKHIKEKYDKKVRGKAIKKVQYDLNKANKSTEDISDTKLEAMVAHKEKEIRASHKEKTWKYIAAFTGISFMSNILRGNIAGAFGFGGDDDEDLDA